MKSNTINYVMDSLASDKNIISFFGDNIVQFNNKDNVILINPESELISAIKANSGNYATYYKETEFPIACINVQYDIIQYITATVEYNDKLIDFINSLPITDEAKETINKYCKGVSIRTFKDLKPMYKTNDDKSE